MFKDLLRVFPSKKSVRICWTLGMREDPPTKTISSISALVKLAKLSTSLTGVLHLSHSSRHSYSNFALFKLRLKSSPSANSSHSIVAYSDYDSCTLAFSQLFRSLLRALLLLAISTPVYVLNYSMQWRTKILSMSWPPRCESPFVASTVNTWSRMVT